MLWLLVPLLSSCYRCWEAGSAAERPVHRARLSGRSRTLKLGLSFLAWRGHELWQAKWTDSVEWQSTWLRSTYRRTSAKAHSANYCKVGCLKVWHLCEPVTCIYQHTKLLINLNCVNACKSVLDNNNTSTTTNNNNFIIFCIKPHKNDPMKWL